MKIRTLKPKAMSDLEKLEQSVKLLGSINPNSIVNCFGLQAWLEVFNAYGKLDGIVTTKKLELAKFKEGGITHKLKQ